MQVTRADDVARFVRERRRDLRVSQHDLADRVGITRQLLSRFEQGKSDLPLAVVLHVMRELTLSLDLRSREDRAGIVELRMPRIPPIVIPAPRIDMRAIRAAQDALVAALGEHAAVAVQRSTDDRTD